MYLLFSSLSPSLFLCLSSFLLLRSHKFYPVYILNAIYFLSFSPFSILPFFLSLSSLLLLSSFARGSLPLGSTRGKRKKGHECTHTYIYLQIESKSCVFTVVMVESGSSCPALKLHYTDDQAGPLSPNGLYGH